MILTFGCELTLQGDLAFVNQVVVEWRTHGTNTSNRRDLHGNSGGDGAR